jgi:hypothetical protein
VSDIAAYERAQFASSQRKPAEPEPVVLEPAALHFVVWAAVRGH